MSNSLILPFPLESILSDIKRSIETKLYYPAVLITLTIPDICSALMLPKTQFVKEKNYTEFVNKYTTEKDLGINGIVCFRLRGGVVHRASFARHPFLDFTHVIFTLPGNKVRVHGFSITARGDKKAAIPDLFNFCKTMDSAARKWYSDNHANPLVEDNMKHLIRFSPFGMAPFFVGDAVVGSGE
jgi:hypothetical protein